MEYSVIIIEPEITPIVQGTVDKTVAALSDGGLVKFAGPNDEVIFINSASVVSVLEFNDAVVNDGVEST